MSRTTRFDIRKPPFKARQRLTWALIAVTVLMGIWTAGAIAASALSTKPTQAAISHWKKTALKRLPPWWKGYLGGPTHLTGCKYMTTKGIKFYDCKIANRIDNSNVLAFASLVRYSRCGYASTFSSTHGHRTLTRRFKLCP